MFSEPSITSHGESAGEGSIDNSEMVMRTAVNPVVRAQRSRSVGPSPGEMSLDRSQALSPTPPPLRRIQRVVDSGTRGDSYEQVASGVGSLQRGTGTVGDTAVPLAASASGPMLTRSASSDEFPLARSVSVVGAMSSVGRTTSQASGGSHPPEIVWRSSAPNMVTRPFAGGATQDPMLGPVPFLARQVAQSPISPEHRSDQVLMKATPASSAMGQTSTSVNIPEIADQVGRFLTRRLAVERERRGMGL
jgi:hypothetical protein